MAKPSVGNLCKHLKIVSINMHGFNQGYSAVDEMINTIDPDVFFSVRNIG